MFNADYSEDTVQETDAFWDDWSTTEIALRRLARETIIAVEYHGEVAMETCSRKFSEEKHQALDDAATDEILTLGGDYEDILWVETTVCSPNHVNTTHESSSVPFKTTAYLTAATPSFLREVCASETPRRRGVLATQTPTPPRGRVLDHISGGDRTVTIKSCEHTEITTMDALSIIQTYKADGMIDDAWELYEVVQIVGFQIVLYWMYKDLFRTINTSLSGS